MSTYIKLSHVHFLYLAILFVNYIAIKLERRKGGREEGRDKRKNGSKYILWRSIGPNINFLVFKRKFRDNITFKSNFIAVDK